MLKSILLVSVNQGRGFSVSEATTRRSLQVTPREDFLERFDSALFPHDRLDPICERTAKTEFVVELWLHCEGAEASLVNTFCISDRSQDLLPPEKCESRPGLSQDMGTRLTRGHRDIPRSCEGLAQC